MKYTIAHLPEAFTQRKIVPRIIIVHTAVDAPGPTNLPGYFARGDVKLESHFWIALDGHITEMMPTDVRADANFHANNFAISIETEDEGNPEEVPWTQAQLESLAYVIRNEAGRWGIPLEICDGPYGTGIGYHVMFGAPGPWTPVIGKTCPGNTRIKQFYDELMPLVQMGDEEMGKIDDIHRWLSEGLVRDHGVDLANLDLGTPILRTNHQVLNVLPSLINTATKQILAEISEGGNDPVPITDLDVDALSNAVSGAVLAALVPGLEAFANAID